ncbi:hypothetical protein [Micromonospora arborensis]|uniref:hypothetical protein n=1 Tax=Micromonospora arborensis TaxID=2116518 RepID=UPI003714AD7B
MIPTAHRPPTDVSRVPPPSRNARIAGYASAAAAVIGFIPLHLVWAFEVPLFAEDAKFHDWYADGGGAYLFALCGLAVLPAVLSLALVRPWGLVFPRWVPMLAGRRVPRRLLVIPGYAVPTLLLLYSLYAVVLTIVQFGSPEAIFSPWTGVYGIIQFIPWWLGLFLATRSYAARTAPRRP